MPLLLPLLLAAADPQLAMNPLPVGSVVPFGAPPSSSIEVFETELGPVETFDPKGRAVELARELPRVWSGVYRSFSGGAPQPVLLRLVEATPMGQMVDLRGEMQVGETTVGVQGNLNAKSDQLDLLMLCDCEVGGMESGGEISGVQGLELAGWVAPRLTNPGGRFDLRPVVEEAASPAEAPATGAPIRGLW
ncbi:hypothetical protein [Synechococcus sp. CS-205]|uniref:hypothetical protein n=1 Tax=Synechococcus sp. CS-205 TaxID=2847984 RepID=UPI00223B8A8D|nr:hypothetical protein [Synechococcus sp. CS-205]MCT0248643.1 hypothetical protein [Synechococcus sp. CS-205]